MISVSNQNSLLVKLSSKNSNAVSKYEYLDGTKRIEYFVFRTRRIKTNAYTMISSVIRAWALHNLGIYEDAIIWYDKAQTVNPNFTFTLNNKKNAQEKIGN